MVDWHEGPAVDGCPPEVAVEGPALDDGPATDVSAPDVRQFIDAGSPDGIEEGTALDEDPALGDVLVLAAEEGPVTDERLPTDVEDGPALDEAPAFDGVTGLVLVEAPVLVEGDPVIDDVEGTDKVPATVEGPVVDEDATFEEDPLKGEPAMTWIEKWSKFKNWS